MTLPSNEGIWLFEQFPKLLTQNRQPVTLGDLRKSYEDNHEGTFEQFINSQAWVELRKLGLVLV